MLKYGSTCFIPSRAVASSVSGTTEAGGCERFVTPIGTFTRFEDAKDAMIAFIDYDGKKLVEVFQRPEVRSSDALKQFIAHLYQYEDKYSKAILTNVSERMKTDEPGLALADVLATAFRLQFTAFVVHEKLGLDEPSPIVFNDEDAEAGVEYGEGGSAVVERSSDVALKRARTAMRTPYVSASQRLTIRQMSIDQLAKQILTKLHSMQHEDPQSLRVDVVVESSGDSIEVKSERYNPIKKRNYPKKIENDLFPIMIEKVLQSKGYSSDEINQLQAPKHGVRYKRRGPNDEQQMVDTLNEMFDTYGLVGHLHARLK